MIAKPNRTAMRPIAGAIAATWVAAQLPASVLVLLGFLGLAAVVLRAVVRKLRSLDWSAVTGLRQTRARATRLEFELAEARNALHRTTVEAADAKDRLATAQTELCTAHGQIKNLEGALHEERECLAATFDTMIALRNELVVARREAERSPNKTDALYGRVGLAPGCPDFVLKAAHTAYRKALHPDVRAAHEKVEAERRFKEVEQVFDRIACLRRS